MALELWRGALQEAVDSYGCADEAEARERFLQIIDRLPGHQSPRNTASMLLPSRSRTNAA